MQWLSELWRRFVFLFRLGAFSRDLEEEMRLHVELRERSRNMWGWNRLETLLQDVRYGLRQLRRTPGFTVVAVVTLALGIGANTAIFQLLDAVRLRSLPIQNPQELAEVRITDAEHQGMGINQQYGELTRPLWQRIRDQQQSFSGVFAWSVNQRYVGRGSEMRHF